MPIVNSYNTNQKKFMQDQFFRFWATLGHFVMIFRTFRKGNRFLLVLQPPANANSMHVIFELKVDTAIHH